MSARNRSPLRPQELTTSPIPETEGRAVEILLKRQGRRLCSLVVLASLSMLLAACQTGDSTVAPAAPAPADQSQGTPPAAEQPAAGPSDASAEDDVSEEIREANATDEATAIKTFFTGMAKAVNDGSFDNPELRDTSSRERFERNEQTMADYAGLHFPGPIPFTATDVTSTGKYASVIGCSVDSGWAQNQAGEPVGSWTTSAAKIELIREDEKWKVDVISPSGIDCTDVPLEKKEWQ